MLAAIVRRQNGDFEQTDSTHRQVFMPANRFTQNPRLFAGEFLWRGQPPDEYVGVE